MSMNESLQVTYELVQTKVQDKAAKQTEKSMKKLSSRAVATNAVVSGAVGAMVGATAALGAAMFLTVGAASKFEDSFAGIRKTVDASEAEFNQLGAQIRQLAQDIPVAVTQLNAIGELGGQLGVDVGNLEEFIDVIAQIGVATRLSTETAALSLARLDQIFGLGGKSFDRLASSLVDLGNNFAALEDEILSTALRLAAAGRVAGATAADVLGIATALQAVGVQSQAGGTAMARVFQQIQIAVAQGGRQLEVFAKTTGLTTQEFQEIAKADPASALNLFVTSLAAASKAGTNIIEVLDQLGLKQQRTIRALLAVGEAEGLLTDALATANSAFEANIALTTESEKRFETFKSQTKLLMNELTELRIQVGNELLPAARGLVKTFTNIINAFQSTDEEVKELAPSLKLLLGVVVAMAGAMTALGTTMKVFGGLAALNNLTIDQLNTRIRNNTMKTLKNTKAILAADKAIKILRISMIGLGAILAVVTIGMAMFRKRQEEAAKASESFLANRAAAASVTATVAKKEKEYQDLLNQENVSDARLELLEAEIKKLKEIEEQINKKSVQDFFKQAGMTNEGAEEAATALSSVRGDINDFFSSGLAGELELNIGDRLGAEATANFKKADKAIATLDESLGDIGMTVEDLDSLAPNELLGTLGLLEAKGVPAFELYSDVLAPIIQANNMLELGTLKLTDAQAKSFESYQKNAKGLKIVQSGMDATKISEEGLIKIIDENVEAYNALENRQNEVAISTEDVLNGTVQYIDILKALEGETENAGESAQELMEATFALSDAVTENINKFRDLEDALNSLSRIGPISINEIVTGMERADGRADVLRQTVVDLANANFVPLAVAITELPLDQALGLALSLSQEIQKLHELESLIPEGQETTDELEAQRKIVNDIQDSLTRGNPELRTMTFNDEQLAAFVEEQENQMSNLGFMESINNRLTVEAEAQLQLEMDKTDAALQIFNIVQQEADTRERIVDLQQEMADFTADIVASGFTITQQQLRQMEVTETQEQLASAIAEYGKEGVVTNSEQLGILQAQLNLQRMRDKIEGKMSNRDKIRIRDKEKEVKFLELAVEQGVAEQIDLDAAKDELEDLKKPISDAEMDILKLQEKIATAQLEVLNGQKERLDPSVVDAIKAVAKAQNLEAEAVEKYAKMEGDLATALLESRLQADKNAQTIQALTTKYPGLKGIVEEIAKDIGIPEAILDTTLTAMDTTMTAYQKHIDDSVQKGRDAMFDIDEIAAFIEKRMNDAANAISNADINYTPPPTEDINRRQYYLPQFGTKTMNNYTGGNVPIGRTSIVGERGPEVIMSTPGGTSVFSNKTGAGTGGITVAHMDVNITGLPADPLSARKAAINIRKELMKLENEGTAGTGLRNR